MSVCLITCRLGWSLWMSFQKPDRTSLDLLPLVLVEFYQNGVVFLRYHQGFSAAQDCLGSCLIRLPFFSHVLEGSDYFSNWWKILVLSMWCYFSRHAQYKSYGAMEISAKISEEDLGGMYARVNICVGNPWEENVK